MLFSRGGLLLSLLSGARTGLLPWPWTSGLLLINDIFGLMADLLTGLLLGLILILLLIEWLALMLWLLDLLRLLVRAISAFLSVFDSVTPFVRVSPFSFGDLSS